MEKHQENHNVQTFDDYVGYNMANLNAAGGSQTHFKYIDEWLNSYINNKKKIKQANAVGSKWNK